MVSKILQGGDIDTSRDSPVARRYHVSSGLPVRPTWKVGWKYSHHEIGLVRSDEVMLRDMIAIQKRGFVIEKQARQCKLQNAES